MRTILTIVFIAAITCAASAQTVVASQGDEYTNATWWITQTIGEPVIATVGAGATQLTQGFEQPWAVVGTAVAEQPFGMPDITVYPNPVRHVLNIAFPSVPVDTRYELFDALGQSLLHDQVHDAITQLDMERLASGGYVLRVIGANGTAMRSFKINVTH